MYTRSLTLANSIGHLGEVPVWKQHRCSHGPSIHGNSRPLGNDLHPYRCPSNINEISLLGSSAPASHEHGNVHASQSKNEVEEAVAVGDQLELIHGFALRTATRYTNQHRPDQYTLNLHGNMTYWQAMATKLCAINLLPTSCEDNKTIRLPLQHSKATEAKFPVKLQGADDECWRSAHKLLTSILCCQDRGSHSNSTSGMESFTLHVHGSTHQPSQQDI